MALRTGRLANGREVVWLRDERLAVAVAPGGGHIAAIQRADAPDAPSPLWVPPWASQEPEAVTEAAVAAEYGGPPEGRTLASILGNNLALGIFGAPSAEETAAGVVTHGFFGVRRWAWREDGPGLLASCQDPTSGIGIERRIELDGGVAWAEETVTNLGIWDRPIAWQQHVTLGPPWLEDGAFWLEANAQRGQAFPVSLSEDSRLQPGAEGSWPRMPGRQGRAVDYAELPLAPASEFAAFQIEPGAEWGYFVAGNRRLGQALFYAWPRAVFPWLGVWDERDSRQTAPWNGRTWTRGLEFGASPFPASRRELLRQPALWDTPAYAWLPAAGRLHVRYAFGLFALPAGERGELRWRGGEAQVWARQRMAAWLRSQRAQRG